ncbi:quinolinate synthase NadA [bacterium]|nr:quinolinate synthase NadA [bacterium]MBU4560978.1 quinolinate synthase NadA [bacterium]
MVNNSKEDKYIEKIRELKKERKTIILAHNYQRPEIQDIADLVGDSLDLSRKAAATDAEVIVFCGVHFMAESAAILSPEKTVLLPVREAGCQLADMITVQELRKKKEENPQAAVVCYVNSSAEVKAESDICCTSANGIGVVNSLKENRILFVPDGHLGRYLASKTKKEFIFWKGFCPTHYNLLSEDILRAKEEHPQAKVLVHPECRLSVIDLADEALSTNGILEYVKKSEAKEFIIGTEMGIIHRLKKENPNKKFYPASENLICPSMKLITLKEIAQSLEEMRYKIEIPEEIRKRAKKSLNRMLAV